MWPGPRPTFVPSGILIHPAIWPQLTWAKKWGLCAFLGGGSWVPINTISPGPKPSSVPKWQFDPSSHLATTDKGGKFPGCAPFWGMGAGSVSNTMSPGPRPTFLLSGTLIHPAIWPQYMGSKLCELVCTVPPFFLGGGEELGPRLTHCCVGQVLPACQVASWSIQPFSHSSHGLKTGGGGCAPFEGAGSPSNTMWMGPRPTSMPGFILIHPVF